ncbi:MAG: transcription factor S [Nanobdellota archaeon]
MLFCKKCGSVMMPKKKKDKKVMVCTSCGHEEKSAEESKLKEVVEHKDEVEVVGNEAEETMSKVEEECPKCGNNEAYYWLLQTRAGDEGETKFYKCTKCKHTWREYD